jgi:hypothetical protein
MIVAITGRAGTGKTTVAEYLIDKGYETVSFATPIKEVTNILLGWSMEILEGTNPENRILKETLKHPTLGMTPRQAMQQIGTVFKNIRDDFWIRIAEEKILSYIKQGKNVVIPDVRFTNEYELLSSLEATIICLYTDEKTYKVKYPELHISENEYIDFVDKIPNIYNKKDESLFEEVNRVIELGEKQTVPA